MNISEGSNCPTISIAGFLSVASSLKSITSKYRYKPLGTAITFLNKDGSNKHKVENSASILNIVSGLMSLSLSSIEDALPGS